MAGSLNKVMIIGNVGRDPEMRFTPNGKAVTTFSVATNRRWTTGEGETRDETEWFNVVMWNKLAETANQYLNKGSKCYIEGRLQTRSWEDKEGQKHYRTELIANSLLLLDSRGKPAPSAEEPFPTEDLEPDDLPF